jgi:hypothetical protein
MNAKAEWILETYSLPGEYKDEIEGPGEDLNVRSIEDGNENGTDGKTAAETVAAEAVNVSTVSTRWGVFHRADEEHTCNPYEARNGLPGGGAKWRKVIKTQRNAADEKPTSEDLCRAVMADYAETIRPAIEERDARPVVEVDLTAENRAQEKRNAAAVAAAEARLARARKAAAFYSDHNGPDTRCAEFIGTDFNAINPLHGLSPVKIAYYRLPSGAYVGIVF